MLSTLQERFDAKTCRAASGCLLWTGSVDGMGYGMLRVDRTRTRRAHRVAWLLVHGAWPEDCLLHSCDTPGCVEIAHLREGSRADNNAERDAKGRGVPPAVRRGVLHPCAKLSNEDVAAICALRGRLTTRAVAAQFGVSAGYVSMLQTRKMRAG